MADDRHTISQRNQPQRDKFVGIQRFPVVHAQVQNQAADQRAHQRAQCQSPCNRPHHVNSPPAPAPISQLVQAKQAQTQHYHREGGTVIEATFTGQAKPQAVTVVSIGNLYFRGQHRVGRRQNCTQQHGGAQRQVQQPDTDGCHRCYRYQH